MTAMAVVNKSPGIAKSISFLIKTGKLQVCMSLQFLLLPFLIDSDNI